MEKKVLNLLDALVAATGRHQDHRFQPWARLVESVDKTKTDGYAFVGGFVKEGTVEVEIKPQVFIVMTSEGSAKYQTKYYNVVVMDTEGNLTKTDIATDESKGQGWALRLRDDVANLVNFANQLNSNEPEPVPNPLTPFSDEQLIAEIHRRLIVL